jgi:hypothetical protein
MSRAPVLPVVNMTSNEKDFNSIGRIERCLQVWRCICGRVQLGKRSANVPN